MEPEALPPPIIRNTQNGRRLTYAYTVVSDEPIPEEDLIGKAIVSHPFKNTGKPYSMVELGDRARTILSLFNTNKELTAVSIALYEQKHAIKVL